MTNLILRIISSLFLIIIFLSLLSESDFIFLFVIQLLLILSFWEFLRLINFSLNDDKKNSYFLSREKININDFFIILLISFSSLIFFFFNNSFLALMLIIFIVTFFYFSFKSNFIKFLGLVYLFSPFLILIDLRFSNNFLEFLTFIVLFSVITDVSSYFCGNFFGGMKLAPKISPGKTISGSIGGILIPSFLCVLIFSENSSLGHIIFSSVIFSITVQVGDLIESKLKRKYKVKDSSSLIPGHGGVLDRFDGIFLLIIIFYVLKILDFNFFFIV